MAIHFLPGKGYDCNLFLIEGREPILVDTGTGGNPVETMKFISSKVPAETVRTIILTHRHYDHVGGAGFLAQELGAKVFIHEDDAEVVSNGDGWGTLSTMFGKPMDAVDVVPVREGFTFTTGDCRFKVLHTPGHSSGSICLHDESSGDLISGDTVFVGGVGRWDLPSGDYDLLVRSIKALQGLQVKSIYPGHGPCGIGNGTEQIAQALSYLGES